MDPDNMSSMNGNEGHSMTAAYWEDLSVGWSVDQLPNAPYSPMLLEAAQRMEEAMSSAQMTDGQVSTNSHYFAPDDNSHDSLSGGSLSFFGFGAGAEGGQAFQPIGDGSHIAPQNDSSLTMPAQDGFSQGLGMGAGPSYYNFPGVTNQMGYTNSLAFLDTAAAWDMNSAYPNKQEQSGDNPVVPMLNIPGLNSNFPNHNNNHNNDNQGLWGYAASACSGSTDGAGSVCNSQDQHGHSDGGFDYGPRQDPWDAIEAPPRDTLVDGPPSLQFDVENSRTPQFPPFERWGHGVDGVGQDYPHQKVYGPALIQPPTSYSAHLTVPDLNYPNPMRRRSRSSPNLPQMDSVTSTNFSHLNMRPPNLMTSAVNGQVTYLDSSQTQTNTHKRAVSCGSLDTLNSEPSPEDSNKGSKADSSLSKRRSRNSRGNTTRGSRKTRQTIRPRATNSTDGGTDDTTTRKPRRPQSSAPTARGFMFVDVDPENGYKPGKNIDIRSRVMFNALKAKRENGLRDGENEVCEGAEM